MYIMKVEIVFSDVDKETKNELKKMLNANYEYNTCKYFIHSHKTDKKALNQILKNGKYGAYSVNRAFSPAYQIGNPKGIYIYTKKKKTENGTYTWHDNEMTRYDISFKFRKSLFFDDKENEKERKNELDELDDIFDI